MSDKKRSALEMTDTCCILFTDISGTMRGRRRLMAESAGGTSELSFWRKVINVYDATVDLVSNAIAVFDSVYVLNPTIAVIVAVIALYGLLQVLKIPLQVLKGVFQFFNGCYKILRKTFSPKKTGG